MRKRWSLAAALSLVAAPAAAQRVQPWPDLFVSGPVASGVVLSGEIIGRVGDDRRTSQLETRLQLAHPLGHRVTVGGGWVHFEDYNPLGPHTVENQAVEQLGWTIAPGKRVSLLTRTRVEQRWLTGVDGTSWRFRQQLRLVAPLATSNGAPRAVVWGEPFVSVNRTSAQTRTLDQLRAFVGINVPLGRRADIEFGYLNQRIYRASGVIANDAIPLILSYRF